ncbi:MAG: DUF6713 family protein [Pseudomonadota bacterium]
MKRAEHFLLYLGLGLLMTHELDAVKHQEWLVLPLTSWLSPEVGYQVFLWFHVPLFAVIVGLLASAKQGVRDMTATVLCVFFAIHAVLHWLFSDHVHYLFETISSNILIFGAAVCGGLYLMLRLNKSAANERK